MTPCWRVHKWTPWTWGVPPGGGEVCYWRICRRCRLVQAKDRKR